MYMGGKEGIRKMQENNQNQNKDIYKKRFEARTQAIKEAHESALDHGMK